MERLTINKEQFASSAKSPTFFKPLIQRKMAIGSSNDRYEVEADNMANKVMNKSDNQHQNFSKPSTSIQRKCAACEQEEKIQKKSLVQNIQSISTTPSENSPASPHVENAINNSKGGGNKMDAETQTFMESRFGADFSDVRIHTGSYAASMSKELNAQAFTVGNDVYFNEGEYNPSSDSGKFLLAHELTHTIQQRKDSSIQKMIYRRELRNARVNYLCGSRDARLRTPPSGYFTLSGNETSIKITSNISWDRANCSEASANYYLILKKVLIRDSSIEEKEIPFGSNVQTTYSGLSSGNNYYFEIISNNTNPNCCLTGNILIEAL